MAARGETQANVEVSTLVVPAWRLRWRAPELALVLGERALALASARHDEADRLRAEALVVFAGNRVGRGVRIADRAIDALKAAEAAGEHETAWLLRVELAACARSVGAPLTGFAAVTPVLEAPEVPAELRASALVQASECLVTVGRGDEPTRALAEADQLYVADPSLDEDTRLLLRGLIRAVQAAQHRRWGDIAAAIGAAREGLDLLSRFTDPAADSGQGLGRLTLELALALMDANRLNEASEIGTPMLDRPVRAPSASTTGWLRLALATRVHLPAGRVVLAREMLRDAAASAERHQLDTLLAESLLALAHVHEVSGELADALTNLRAAHAAERRRARAVYAVRARLAAEFSGVHRQPADLHQQLADLLRPVEGMPIVTDGILTAALKQQLRQWRPVQVRKGDSDSLKVKRVRRAAEDMTVEGLSAARQHAADRWRMVQPFGEPDDKSPDPIEPPPPVPHTPSDRTVPASGLIASAGAMVSGRRRAARVAAGEIDDDQPTDLPTPPPAAPASPEPQPAELTADQERKRKVEQQLMELQREARRQIEAERQARAEQRAQAEREAQAAEEAARQEAAREEASRQEAARQEAARQEAARRAAEREEAARREAARQEAARQELARHEAAFQETAREAAARREAARAEAAARDEAARAEATARESSSAQPESVLEMLKAQGLRAGGRRRARDTDTQPETPSWRVEPPSRLRNDDEPQATPQTFFTTPADSPTSQDFSTGSHPSGDANYSATPDSPPSQDFLATPRTSGGNPSFLADLTARDADLSAPQDLSADRRSSADGPDYFADAMGSGSARSESRASQGFSADARSSGDGQDYFADSAGAGSARSESRASQDFSADARSSGDGQDYFADPAGSAATRSDSRATQGYSADTRSSGDRPDGPNHFADPSGPASPDMPDRPTRSGLAAAFSRPPAAPDFGPHLDDPDPAYPLYTPAGGFPTPEPDPDERKLPDLDFSSLDFSTPKSQPRPDASIPTPDPVEQPDPAKPTPPKPAPDPDPEHKPLPPIPDPVPSVPVPDEIPQAPEPDLMSSTFLSSADVDDDIADLPTAPVPVQLPPGETAFGTPRTNPEPATPANADFATGPELTTPATQPGFGASPDVASTGDPAAQPAESDSATYDFFATRPDSTEPSDAADVATSTDADGPSDTGNAEPEGRSGRPSSRRKPSDLSLADLLAEALVAYETGRRSDEEQLGAADLTAPDWSAVEPTPDQPALPERPTGADDTSGSESYFRPGESFGSQPTPDSSPSSSESLFLPEQPASSRQFSPETPAEASSADSFFGSQQPAEATSGESYLQTGPSFGSQQPAGESSVPAQPGGESYFSARPSFGTQQPAGETPGSGTDSFFQPGQSFGTQRFSTEPPAATGSSGQDSFFLPEQPASEAPFGAAQAAHEAPLGAESSAEKTGPIVPVGAAPDNETTGPIRRVQQDIPDGPGGSNGPGGFGGPGGPAGWTLPG